MNNFSSEINRNQDKTLKKSVVTKLLQKLKLRQNSTKSFVKKDITLAATKLKQLQKMFTFKVTNSEKLTVTQLKNKIVPTHKNQYVEEKNSSLRDRYLIAQNVFKKITQLHSSCSDTRIVQTPEQLHRSAIATL